MGPDKADNSAKVELAFFVQTSQTKILSLHKKTHLKVLKNIPEIHLPCHQNERVKGFNVTQLMIKTHFLTALVVIIDHYQLAKRRFNSK
jgi:hypothetical protein